MTWVRIDDSMPEHPKMVALTDRAFRQHVSALCYCNRNLTDGAIPDKIAHRLVTSGKRFAAELVDAGIWDKTVDGYQIHDYEDYQPTRAAVLRERSKTAERVARWRERNAVTPPDGNGVTNGAPIPVPVPAHIPKEDQSFPRLVKTDHEDQIKAAIPEGTKASIHRLLRFLTDADEKTINRLVRLAQRGASQGDFEDAGAAVIATRPDHPSRYACSVVEKRLQQKETTA